MRFGGYFTRILATAVAAVIMTTAAPAVAAVPAADELSARYRLAYSVEDAGYGDKLAITSDGKGRVELQVPFISGGCIAVNEVKLLSEVKGEDGLRTLNLLWNSDRGAPCKAALPVKLKANLELPEPGRYRVRLWETVSVNSTKFRLAKEQEVELPSRSLSKESQGVGKSLNFQDDQEALKNVCLAATVQAVRLEMGRVQAKPFLAQLEADLEKYRNMKAADYTLPEKTVETAWVEEKAGDNAVLYVEGMSRSGPWYHLSGIVGGDYGQLKPGVKATVSYYRVYPRKYWHMPSSYVCVEEVR